MSEEQLPDDIYRRVEELSEQGNQLADQERHMEAVSCFERAYALLPEPKDKWDAGTWLLVAIGDSYFLAKLYGRASEYFTMAKVFPGALENPFIWLRLGQCLYEEGGQEEAAADALIRAYMLDGERVFAEEDPKYMVFLRKHAIIDQRAN